MKKALSIVIAAMSLTAMFTGCKESSSSASQETSSPTSSATTAAAKGVTYPIEGNVTLSLAMAEEPAVNTTCAFADTPFAKAWQEATGVTLKINHPADFALLFASGDLPDIIYYGFNDYSGGAAQAIADQIIYPITDLIEQNAPDFTETINNNDQWKKSIVTEKGDIIGFPFIRGDEYLLTNAGMIIRQDWLDKLKMEVPQTPDELYTTLVAFKEQMGATAPFSANSWWMQQQVANGIITSPFGLIKGDYYQKDGTVYYGSYQEEYKDVLIWLNKLYSEGLIDPNFTTADGNTVNSNFMNGQTGLTLNSVGGGMGVYLTTMADKNPDFNVSGVGSLVAKKGDKAMSSRIDNPNFGQYTVITTACKNKEAAAQFLNYGYTEEGNELFNFGIEGESYEYIKDYPTYKDVILKNPNGLTIQQSLAQYCRSWASGPFIQRKEYMEQYASRPQQKEAIKTWMNTDASKYMMPAITIAQDSSDQYSKLTGDINTYVSEMFIKFVTGIEPLDKFETYLSTLKDMGMDKVIEMQQSALDEYNAR